MDTKPPSDRVPSSARSLVHALIIIAVLVQSLLFAAVCVHDLLDVSPFALAEDLVASLMHTTRTPSHTASMTLEFHPPQADIDQDPPR